VFIGRCRMMLQMEMSKTDPKPKKSELNAVDGSKNHRASICGVGGTMHPENKLRHAISRGLLAIEAFTKYGAP